MKHRSIEPGLLRIFRYFTGVAMIYFAALVTYTAIQTGEGDTTSQIQSYLNFGTNLILLGYLSWRWLQRKLKRFYLPVALIAATVVPIFSNLIYLAEPQEEAYFTIMQSWLLFPILVVPLVLIAWQYSFRYVLIFILFSTAVELSVLFPKINTIDFATVPILGVPFIRAFSFGTLGHIVTRLIDTQRAQRKELIRANIQLSQHANTLEQLTTSRERNRLARELHDTLAHTLSGLTVNLEAIKIILGDKQQETRALVERALRNTRTGLLETRRALKDLRVKQLDELGLGIAIRNLANDAAARSGFHLQYAIDENLPEIPPDAEQCFYRIAQETLENIVKHARARHVSINLSKNKNGLMMIISDDGKGFDLSKVDFEDNLGIKGMNERALEVGAIFDISPQSEDGTIVQLTLENPYG
ncbi:MAG: sensor histidine kinase [Chloroflexota bacterium]|nr:sensor histidine kinase [Chloroflexota bacterium]